MSRPPRFDRKGIDPIPPKPRPLKWRWISAVQEEDSGLTSTQRHVAIAHALFGDEDGSNVYPGAYTIAKQTAYNVKTVEKARVELERAGWFRCLVRGGIVDGHRQRNEYVLTIPRAVDKPAQPPVLADTPPADDGWSGCQPPVVDDAPPAHDSTTTRPGREDLISDQPDDQPTARTTRPPAQDGGSKLQPEVVEQGLANVAALRTARAAS